MNSFLDPSKIREATFAVVQRNLESSDSERFAKVVQEWQPRIESTLELVERKILEPGMRESFGSRCVDFRIPIFEAAVLQLIAYDAALTLFTASKALPINCQFPDWDSRGSCVPLGVIADPPNLPAFEREFFRRHIAEFGESSDKRDAGIWRSAEWGDFLHLKFELDQAASLKVLRSDDERDRYLRSFRRSIVRMNLIKNRFPGGKGGFATEFGRYRFPGGYRPGRSGEPIFYAGTESIGEEERVYYCYICSAFALMVYNTSQYYWSVGSEYLREFLANGHQPRTIPAWDRVVSDAQLKGYLESHSSEFGDLATEYYLCASCMQDAIDSLSGRVRDCDSWS